MADRDSAVLDRATAILDVLFPAGMYVGALAAAYWGFRPQLTWQQFTIGVTGGIFLLHETIRRAIIRARR